MEVSSALIAVGSRENQPFGFRDAVLLEAIAKQAGLAFENLEYAELLRGRIELANRDLRDAYIVLAEQSAKFMAAVENIDDALIICDAVGNALFVNPGAAPTLREATPLLGHSVPDRLRRENLEAIAALFDCLHVIGPSLQPESARCEEVWRRFENDDDQDRILSAQLTPLFADGERLIGAMLLVSDITAQRELDQMKTDFVSFVAHELRSPLSAILGYATLMEQYGDQTDLQTRNEMAAAITRQCHRLNRLIGDLLDISRIEAGHVLELRRERVELCGLTEKVLDAQRAALSNPHIELELDCGEEPVTIWGDPDRLEQVLVNLVSNAVKYSPEGGRIVTSIADSANGVDIQVRDHGMGMTADQVDNLFQKFYRTPEARLRGIKGTGLGLFLVKNLIEAHRGTISVESTIGEGTTFSIHLPRRTGELSATGSMLDFDQASAPQIQAQA
jgi:signal transduction histidine kinase